MTDSTNKFSPLAWLDRFSWQLLLPIAIIMGLAPFFPEPHLWEKLKMLAAGTLVKPIDIFDLCMHSTPLILVFLKGLHPFFGNRK